MATFDLRQINHFMMHKQHLAEDSKSDDIVRIVDDIGGLHATGPTTPYLSLLARTTDFTKEDLDRELYSKKTIGKVRCMRKTVYILTKNRIPAACAATAGMSEMNSERFMRYLGVSQEDYEKASGRILQILAGRGLTTKEIKAEMQSELNISPIVNLMCDRGLLVRGAPKSGWRSSIHTYYLFKEHFPDVRLDAFDENEAKKTLIEYYLATFGPATESDVAWWTGLPKTDTRRALEKLGRKSASIRIAGLEADHILSSADEELIRTGFPASPKTTVSLLPFLDPYIMGYKVRGRYMDYADYDMIFDRSGNAAPTVMLDGRIIGIWDVAETDGEPLVKLFLFEGVSGEAWGEIKRHAQRTGEFIAGKRVQVRKCSSMVPLPKRTAGGFMTPLRES